jgi:hypothetical protein
VQTRVLPGRRATDVHAKPGYRRSAYLSTMRVEERRYNSGAGGAAISRRPAAAGRGRGAGSFPAKADHDRIWKGSLPVQSGGVADAEAVSE